MGGVIELPSIKKFLMTLSFLVKNHRYLFDSNTQKWKVPTGLVLIRLQSKYLLNS